MKTTILKKMMPFAVFVLGITGAFFTVSMQSSAKAEVLPIIGYVDALNGGSPCDIPVDCDTETGDICRQFDDSGPVAKAKFPNESTTCSREVYRPE
ncbi:MULTISPECIES: DUF6520 family protein [Flavobacterium]|uniref:DUF6520 family protein n=1 Tax=Flavobacterium TaxID=237 RepID=UPI00211486CE|nr:MULTISPECIES: DUF6520 family protein [Flavobacterium]UUF13134.1 DUF6520 family protein [Flavobacterium panici]